jgi:hypothetical protein
MVSVSAYLYGQRAEQAAAALQPHLAPWVTAMFPAPAAPK